MIYKLLNMKKLFLLFVLVFIAINSQAQYSVNNSFIRKALVIYKMDGKGFYQESSDIMLDYVDGVTENYAYDKKVQTLYILTSNSNCAITLNKDYAKIIKKNKSIPQLKDEELDAMVSKYTKQLDDKYAALNDARTKHIQDSIAKAKADSIEAERQKALKLAK